MKAWVTHDEHGNIVSVNVPNPDADVKITVLPAEGEQVCEVNIDGTPKDFADETIASRKLAEVVEQFRVAVPVRRGKLVSLIQTPTKQTDKRQAKKNSKSKAKKKSRKGSR